MLSLSDRAGATDRGSASSMRNIYYPELSSSLNDFVSKFWGNFDAGFLGFGAGSVIRRAFSTGCGCYARSSSCEEHSLYIIYPQIFITSNSTPLPIPKLNSPSYYISNCSDDDI